MKKVILFFAFISVLNVSFSQVKTDSAKVYHNELGVDVTGFIRLISPVVQGEYYGQYYYLNPPTYFLTLRRHFKCGNIRAGIGGGFTRRDVKNYYNTADTKKYVSLSHSISTRLGWEFTNEISKRWQVYYGLDLKYSKQYNNSNGYYFNADYITSNESTSQTYAVSPLLGFRFRLTNRLSLTTEACFAVNFDSYSSKRTFTPTSNLYPYKDNEVTPRTNSITSSFTQPMSLILTFDI